VACLPADAAATPRRQRYHRPRTRPLTRGRPASVASQPITSEGLESVRLLDEEVALALPPSHPLAHRTSVGIEELADQPLIATLPGHWQRRLLDQLFAGRGLTPRIVCEGDEAGAIAELISAGLGIGLVPVIARRTISRVPPAWVGVDNPDCHRVLTLYWAQGGRLPACCATRSSRGTGRRAGPASRCTRP
jgi:DNA-binding transcriptional LysR family regulator